jgi:hypothetical protein
MQKLWNARDGKFIKNLRGHVAPVGGIYSRNLAIVFLTNMIVQGLPMCLVC